MVALGFGGNAIRGKVRDRMNCRLDIQMMAIKEGTEGRTVPY